MPDFGIMRGFNDKLFGDKLVAGQLPTQLGVIGSQIALDFDADAVAFFDRVTAAGGSLSATEKTAVNTLVVQMKADGTWTFMKAIYPMVGASAAACAQNLKSSSFTGTFTATGWTFASTGVKGNGTSAYMNTNLSPLSALVNNNSHISYYTRNTSTNNSFPYLMGSYKSSAPTSFYAMNTGPTTTYTGGLGNVSVLNTGVIVGNNIGFFLQNRETNNDQKAYINSNLLNTVVQTSTSMSSFNILLNALSIDGTANLWSNYECAFSSIGDGLNATQASNFYTAVQAFQTTLSRNV